MQWMRAAWQVDPSQRFIRGCVTHVIVWDNDADTFTTELASALQVDSILYHGKQLAPSRKGDYGLQVVLPATATGGSTDSITICYQGSPVSDGLGSFEQAMLPDSSYWLWTLSQPYGARDWWPVIERLDDKLDSVVIHITTPMGSVGVSNGLLVETDTLAELVARTFVHRYPITPYLVAIAAAPYVFWIDTVNLSQGSLPVVNYVLPADTAIAKAQIPALYPVFTFFDSLFLPYPFMAEQYGHARFGYGGGMEHQTMSFIGNYNYELLVHELAHQWFGNLTTCGSWQDIWLNEGFADYLTGISFERFSPDLYWPLFLGKREETITAAPDGSVWVADTSQVFRIFNGRLSYFKGAWVLHQLRWVVGDDAFWQGCRNWLTHPDLAFGYGRTAQLQTIMEAASGMDLDTFFRNWVYGEGHPDFVLHWRQSGNVLEGWLSQTTSHPSVELFEMPVPVRLGGDWGDTTIIMYQTQANQPFRLLIAEQIDDVALDPDNKLLGSTAAYRLAERAAFTVLTMGNGRFQLLPAPVDLQVDEWRICQAGGQVVSRGSSANWTGQVDLSALPIGVYFLQVLADSEWITIPLVR